MRLVRSGLRGGEGLRYQLGSDSETGQRQIGQERRGKTLNTQDLFNTVGEMAAKRRGEPVTLGTKVTNKKDKKKKSGCC
jgi:hypothetical protein